MITLFLLLFLIFLFAEVVLDAAVFLFALLFILILLSN